MAELLCSADAFSSSCAGGITTVTLSVQVAHAVNSNLPYPTRSKRFLQTQEGRASFQWHIDSQVAVDIQGYRIRVDVLANSSNACKSPQCNRDVDNTKRGFHPEGFDDGQRLCCILGDFNLNSVTFGHVKQPHVNIFDNELKHVKLLFSLC